MHILNVKVECIFYFDERNQITPGAMVHIGLHMSKILSMQKCFTRTDIKIGKKVITSIKLSTSNIFAISLSFWMNILSSTFQIHAKLRRLIQSAIVTPLGSAEVKSE